jgi:hypothetical protein
MSRDPSHRRRANRPLAALSFLCCVGRCVSVYAEAAAPKVFLGWHVPPAAGCIPAQALEREVEDLLGRSVFVERIRADVTLVGTIQQGSDRAEWLAVLRLEKAKAADQPGPVRELSAAGECSQLNRSLAIIIATLVDTLDSRPGWDERPQRTTFAMGLTLDAALGVLPHAALGGSMIAWLTPASARVALRVRLGGLPPQRLTSANVVTHFEAFAAELTVCPKLFANRALHLAACGGVELAALRGWSGGLTNAQAPLRLLASVPLLLSLSLRLLPGAALQLELGPTLAALRPAFYYEDGDNQRHVIHRVAHWGAGARLGFIADVF